MALEISFVGTGVKKMGMDRECVGAGPRVKSVDTGGKEERHRIAAGMYL